MNSFRLSLIIAALVPLSAALAQQQRSDCYRGPPSSAKQCPKNMDYSRLRHPRPVQGKPFKRSEMYGTVNEPVECVEEQIRWVDNDGCYQYCRLQTRCGDT